MTNEMIDPTDYTGYKWNIAYCVDSYDLKATFYPDEDCYLCYREWKDEADMSVYIGGNHREYKLPAIVFRKVINEVIGFVAWKNNVRIPKIEF